MKHKILRVLSVSIILGAAAVAPAQAPAATSTCNFIVDVGCPGDLSYYDLRCQNLCGYGTYAGACVEGGPAAPRSVIECYYEQE